MKLTPIQLAKRVEQWQKRLPLLGVGHVTIKCVTLCDETPGGPQAKATVQSSTHYDEAHFWFTFDFIAECDEAELDQTIIHEWVHVAMRDLDSAIESVDEQLSPAVNEVWTDRLEHEREGLVDKIARQIYHLWLASRM